MLSSSRRSLGDLAGEVVEAALVLPAAAQELAHRALGRVPGHHVLADRVQRLGEVDRRRERVRPAGVPAVAGAVARSRRLASAIDRLAAVGLLADLAGQVQALERQLDGAGALAVVGRAEPVADLVVQLGLASDRAGRRGSRAR